MNMELAMSKANKKHTRKTRRTENFWRVAHKTLKEERLTFINNRRRRRNGYRWSNVKRTNSKKSG